MRGRQDYRDAVLFLKGDKFMNLRKPSREQRFKPVGRDRIREMSLAN